MRQKDLQHSFLCLSALLLGLATFVCVCLPGFRKSVVVAGQVGPLAHQGTVSKLKRPYEASKQGGNYMFNYYFPPAPSTTPWAPCWSPDGKWIAIGLYGSIWKVEIESGTAHELTYNSAYHSSPDWSPDGKWIVYAADHDGQTIQLEIVNLETGEIHPLTSDQHIYTDPVFSPEGNLLAYVSTKPNGYFNIFVRPIRDGQWAGDEVALTEDHHYGKDRLYFGPWDMHIQPAWIPDGKEILFVSNRNVPLGSGNVWRMPVEPLGIRKALSVLDEQTLYRVRPHASLDGKRFIYSSTAGAADQFSHLYLLPTTGGAPYKLTFGSHDDFHPRWSPDGEWIAYTSNQPKSAQEGSKAEINEGASLPGLWLLETYGGAKKPVPIRDYRWKRPMGKIHVQVRDGKTSGKTAARIYALASDGKFYAPNGAYSRIGELSEHVFHSEGDFTLKVPPGTMTIEAVKGFEYWPAKQKIEVKTGEVSEVLLTLKPMVDMAAGGWYSGSTHVHMNYGGNLRNTLQNLMMMSRAEDQDVINMLVANKDNRVLDWQYFVPGGNEHPSSKQDPRLILIVGEEYRPPFYGHVSFIGLRDHLISPFTTGYEGTAIESLYPSNTDMFRKAQAQGAAVGYVHSLKGDKDPLELDLGVAKAFPVDAALGTIHTMEWSEACRAALKVWHHALNNDLPIAPVGGEDSITNLHRTKLVGTVRTYAYLGKDFTAGAWIEALKQGKTFFSSGPLLEFKINGRLPGESLSLPAEGGIVTLEAKVWSIVPLSKVVIYHNGQSIRELPLNPDRMTARFEEKLRVERSGWFSLSAEGPEASHPIDANFPQAATNVIRVYVGHRKIRDRESAVYFVRWIDKLTTQADRWPGWRSEAERKHVFSQFDQARKIYERLAQEAAESE